MNIVIDPLDRKSIDAAYRMVEQFKRDFKTKERELVRRLAEIGVQVAQSEFSSAAYDGTADVVVRLEQTSSGAAVIASGTTVGFIEFGTGVKNPEWNGAGMEFTPPAHGTYGKGHGKQPWGWWFNPSDGGKAVHTYGNAPAEAMVAARDNMIERVTQIAREVFNK